MRFLVWFDCIVPLAVEGVALDVDSGQFGFGDFDTAWIARASTAAWVRVRSSRRHAMGTRRRRVVHTRPCCLPIGLGNPRSARPAMMNMLLRRPEPVMETGR